MNAGELENEFRLLVDDTDTQAPLWTTEEFYRWLNEAEVEACRRARLIVDSRTFEIALATGEAFYEVDQRIIYVRRAMLTGRTIPLTPHDYRDMDACAPGWEDHTGTVTGYIRGLDSGQFRPYRIPEAASNGVAIKLLVVREPLAPMESEENEPEINARYHRSLIDWVCYRAYSKKDSETADETLALKHLKEFEREFGTREKASAMEEEWQRLTLPHDSHDGTY